MARGTQVVKQSKSVVKQSEAVVKRSVALARMSRWLEARRCQYLSCCTSKASKLSTKSAGADVEHRLHVYVCVCVCVCVYIHRAVALIFN